MKKYSKVLLSLFFGVLSFAINAQLEPVHWRASVQKVNETTFELQLKAVIDPGWHIYSQKESEAEIAPIPTNFEYDL